MSNDSNSRPRIIGFARLLEILGHGSNPDDHTSVNSKHADERFKTVVRPSRQVIAGAGSKAGNNWHEQTDYWFGVNPLVTPSEFKRSSLSGARTGRGAEADVQRLVALYADLDIKSNGLADMAAVDMVIDSLAGLLGGPAIEIETGGGVHVYWPIDGEIKGRPAKALLRRFGRMVADVAHRHGGKVDSVFDLARVLRIPGSANWKTGEPRPIVAFETPGWTPISVEQAEIQLDRYGIPIEKFGDIEINGGPVLSASAEWQFAEQTCPYVATVLGEWPTDDPIGGERHRTVMAKATRLAAFWRSGCITAEDYDNGIEVLRDWLSDHRPEEPGEVAAAVAWGVEHIATRTAKAIESELGHDPSHPDGRESAGSGLTFPGGKRSESILPSTTAGRILKEHLDPAEPLDDLDLEDIYEPESEPVHLVPPEIVAEMIESMNLEDLADPEEDDKLLGNHFSPSYPPRHGEDLVDLEDLADPEEDRDPAELHPGEPTAERTRMLADALVELDRLTDNELASLVVFLATVGPRSGDDGARANGWIPDPDEPGAVVKPEFPGGADRRIEEAHRQDEIVGRKIDGSPITDWSDMVQPLSTEDRDAIDAAASQVGLLSEAAARSANGQAASPRTDATGETYETGSSPVWHLAHLLDDVDPALTRCEHCGGPLTLIGRSKILADCRTCFED